VKLASLREGGRDGTLVVVSTDLTRCCNVPGIAITLQAALDRWTECAPQLAAISTRLNAGEMNRAQPFDPAAVAAPLPRAYQWLDGSAYLNHVELVRKARKAEMPQSFWTDPLMYQGGSDVLLGPRDPIRAASEEWGIDFEAEVAVILDDVPMGVTPAAAASHIKLVAIVNDVSLRNLIPAELGKGFGFLHGKPPTAFSPVAVTPDELGPAWAGGKVNLPLVTTLNGTEFGRPNAGVDMNFDFPALIAHAARTRPLGAGTILGSGTVSNKDRSAGSACLAEIRMIETIEGGKPVTPFMRFGDRVRIEMPDPSGTSIFGAIEQVVERYAGP
jgi:fumarylacetoacetate (FAA) hydrolase